MILRVQVEATIYGNTYVFEKLSNCLVVHLGS